MKKFLSQLFTAGVMVGMMSCSSDEPGQESNEYVPPVFSADQSRLVSTQRNVSFTMWDAVKSTVGKENMVFSPLSVNVFTSMIANAADGETREAILEGLGMKGESIDELNRLNAKMLEEFPKLDKRVALTVCNSIWNNPAVLSIKPSFTEGMKSIYALETKTLCNDGEKNRKEINAWIENKTKGMIKNFFDVAITDPLELVNTVYFKAPWAATDVKETKIKFTSKSGEQSDVAAFKLNGQAFTDDNLQVATAEYGNEAFRLPIVMPESGDLPTGKEIESKWAEWKKMGQSASLVIPEWDVEMKYGLDYAMIEMGLGKILAEDASFANMTSLPGQFRNICHGVHIITNSKGTEAAAVTAGGFTMSGPLQEVKLDRPFVYIISEKTTDAVLFIGEVTKL